MGSTTSSIQTIGPDLHVMRILSAVSAILFGGAFGVTLVVAIGDIGTGSPRTIEAIVQLVALSLMLFGTLFTLSSRYQNAVTWRWHVWQRRSRAERFRTIRLPLLGGVVFAVLAFVGPSIAAIWLWPGQDFPSYFLQSSPAFLVLAAAFYAATVARVSARSPAGK